MEELKTEEKKMDRKSFLSTTTKYAAGAMVGAVGLNALSGGKLFADEKNAAWPFPYAQLDPDEVRNKAHYYYYNDKDCCAGSFGGILEVLKTKVPDPWNNIPMEIMLFGRGGGNGWGTLCGAINGGAAMISMVVDKATSGNLINELWGWYCQENLPTTKANEFAAQGKYTMQKFNGTLVQNVSGSPICHSSVSQWCLVAKKKVSDVERKERCARITGDCAAKTVELLNANLAKQFTPTFVTPADAKACLGCHGSAALNNVMTQMSCTPCHGDPHKVSGIVLQNPQTPSEFELSQNYPNPFNPSTTIKFSIPKADKVQLAIYDIQGSLVKTLVDHEMLNAGSYNVDWNGKNESGMSVASGIYFARITSKQYLNTIKMNLVK